MSKLIVQEKIRNLNNIKDNLEDYFHECDEIIRVLIDSDEIYTLVSKDSSEKFIKTGKGNIRYGVHENVPTMWLFSEEKIAKEYADYYNLKLNGEYLIKKIPYEELSIEVYRAMFSGVVKLIIDEGRDYLTCTLYDIVNQCLLKSGQEPILERQEYIIMNILNSVKYANTRLWVTPRKGTNINEIIYGNFLPAVEDNYVRFFLNEQQSKEYSKSVGNNNGISIDLNMEKFHNIIEKLLKSEVKSIKFIINDIESKISIEKLNILLNKMN